MQAIVRSKIKKIPEEISGLFGDGSVNFKSISQSINPADFDPELLEEIRNAVCEKVFDMLILGNFGDLKGAEELLEKLGIQRMSLFDEDLFILQDSFKRISEHDLMVLCTSQTSPHGEYNLVKARKILNGAGYSEKELTDNRIKKILDWRHVLIQVKSSGVDQIGSFQKLLEACE